MSYPYEPFGGRGDPDSRGTPSGDDPSETLTGGTALVFSTLLGAPDHRSSYGELSNRCWPGTRPAHWKRLILLYSRWLEKRLPPGWTLTEDEAGFQLELDGDAIENYALVDGIITNVSAPADPGATLDEAFATAHGPRGTDGPRACSAHERTCTSLPSLVAETGLSAITYRPGQPVPELHTWRDVLAAEGRPPGFAFVAGAAPDLAFGDAAAAFGAARWELLDIDGVTPQARVAQAWRIIREHLPAASGPHSSSRNGVIFDAHRLDDSSLELARLTVRFPLAEDMSITFVGDETDSNPGWQQLLDDLANAGCPRFGLCPECDASLLSGYQVVQRPSLCGKH